MIPLISKWYYVYQVITTESSKSIMINKHQETGNNFSVNKHANPEHRDAVNPTSLIPDKNKRRTDQRAKPPENFTKLEPSKQLLTN